MPLAFDPSETFPVSLSSDAGKPEAERPAFRFHYLSSRGYRKRQKLIEEWSGFYERREKRQAEIAAAGGDAVAVAMKQVEASNRSLVEYEKLLECTYAVLADKCTGWDHIPAAFESTALDTVLNDAEARELLETSCLMNRLQVAEKKGSGSPSSGEPGSSAPADVPKAAAGSQPQTASPEALTAPPAKDATPSAPSAAEKPGS